MTPARESAYMHWAKTRPKVKYDLALSGIANLSLVELEVKPSDLELHGDNSYGYGPLMNALANHCEVAPESVVTVSGGTSMANHLAMAAIIQQGDEVLIEQPTYEPTLAVAKYLGAEIGRFSRKFENNYGIDIDELSQRVTPRTRLICLTNLHNPSCVLTDVEMLGKIAKLGRAVGARILVDEVYLQAVFENSPRSSFHLGPEFVATSSLTKAYGLSGLRSGWILAAPELAEEIRLFNDIFGAVGPHPTERLSVIALAQLPKIVDRAKGILGPNREALRKFLESRTDLDVVWPGDGMTVFPRLRAGSVEQLCSLLVRDYDTAVVPGSFFESPNHFRIGMCCSPELFAAGLKSLGHALDWLSA